MFLTDTKVRRVLVCLAICYRKNKSILSERSVMRHLEIQIDSCGCLSPGFKSWLLHHANAPAHMSLLVRNFLANNNTVGLFTRFGPLWLYPVSKTKETHERTEIYYDWGDKNYFAGRAQHYTRKCFSEVLRELEKALAQVYCIRGRLLWKGLYRYWWINKYFSRKIKIDLISWTDFVRTIIFTTTFNYYWVISVILLSVFYSYYSHCNKPNIQKICWHI